VLVCWTLYCATRALRIAQALDNFYGIHKIEGVEKSTPHYRLNSLKAVVATRSLKAFTLAAQRGAGALEVSQAEAVGVVLALRSRNFYKSMTTHADHRVWQDVYHARCQNGRMAYIKLTLRDDGVVVIQFKEL
jgi:motility quorum-sensing regulator/GCU-specific mRNA interferase toxin